MKKEKNIPPRHLPTTTAILLTHLIASTADIHSYIRSYMTHLMSLLVVSGV